MKIYWDKHLNQSSIISSILNLCYKTTLFNHNNISVIINRLQKLYMLYLLLNNQTIPLILAWSSYDYFFNLLNQNNIQEVSYNELDRYLNSLINNHTNSLI